MRKFYRTMMDISPAPLGVIIHGIDLTSPVAEDVVQEVKNMVHKHRLVIFKKQCEINGNRQVEISKWFGPLESTFYKHHRSPHPDVFRVSNDENEGCTNVGRTGWHIDGSFQRAPFGYSLYNMVSVPKTGDTAFIPLKELINSLSDEKRKKWDRLWMASDRRNKVIHPVIYSHPVTRLPTLCFHLGMTESFVWDYGTPAERYTDDSETVSILRDIHREIVKDDRRLIYSHKWEVGDFIISDNRAVGHEATPESQYPVLEVGLRVLHRTTVASDIPPAK